MQHIKTMLACMAATLLFSCSKKEGDKTPDTPGEPRKTHWIVNGHTNTANDVLYQTNAFRSSIYEATTLKAQWYLSFNEAIKSGNYTIGDLVEQKQVYMFASDYLKGIGVVYDSRPYETATVKVTIGTDGKKLIEIPEIWMKNRDNKQDSCRFSALFVQE